MEGGTTRAPSPLRPRTQTEALDQLALVPLVKPYRLADSGIRMGRAVPVERMRHDGHISSNGLTDLVA